MKIDILYNACYPSSKRRDRMPRKKDPEFDNYRYQQDYIKKNIKLVNFSLNRTKPEDMKMLEWLNSRPQRIGTYIKDLIKKDMNK